MSHREEDQRTLSWKTLLLWLLLVRNGGKEGVHVLEAAHCGTSACAVVLSLLITKELPVSCSGLVVSPKSSALSCIPAQRQDAGCRWDRFFLGTYTLALSFRKALDPFPFTGFKCRCLSPRLWQGEGLGSRGLCKALRCYCRRTILANSCWESEKFAVSL